MSVPCDAAVGAGVVALAVAVVIGASAARMKKLAVEGADRTNRVLSKQLSARRREFPIRSQGARTSERCDLVDVSAFSQEVAPAGTSLIVQILLHRIHEADTALARAREADPDTKRRGITTLAIEIPRLRRVHVTLEAPGLEIHEPAQAVVWRGEPVSCQFEVRFPSDAASHTYALWCRVALPIDVTGDSVPLGSLRFSIRGIAPNERIGVGSDIRGEHARRYKRAFLSYTTPDRPEVLKHAQTLKLVGISFFQDLLNIEPGERWERRLYPEIDSCDLFLLFWSKHAVRSEWVIREAEYALRRQESDPDRLPDIRPVIIDGPPSPPPPPALQALHFNDAMRYLIWSAEAERAAADVP